MIDTSGSMYGEKLSHAVDALKNIITALPDGDNFNIIRYGNKVKSWRQYMAKSDEKVKAKAFEFLDEITAGGSTDLEGALLEAIDLASMSEKARIPIILFLTDGGPNVGGKDVQTVVQEYFIHTLMESYTPVFFKSLFLYVCFFVYIFSRFF